MMIIDSREMCEHCSFYGPEGVCLNCLSENHGDFMDADETCDEWEREKNGGRTT